jgi:HlyD family secretion protein
MEDGITGMKRVVAVLVVLALIVGGWYAFQQGWLSHLRDASLGNAGEGSPTASDHDEPSTQGVVALGRIRPSGGIVDIAGLAGDRLASILVEEGDSVSKNQVLARLESHSMRKLELDAAESQLEDARARLRAEQKLGAARIRAAELAVEKAQTAAQDIEAQEAKVQLARVNLQLAQTDQTRLENLRQQSRELVSDQELDRQKTLVEQARAELIAGAALLKKLDRTHELLVEAAEADREAAVAGHEQMLAAIPVHSLEKQRQLAQKQFEQTEINSPIDGHVLKILARPGETLTGAPAFQVADLSQMVVVAEVYETEAKRIEVGQTAIIDSRALRAPYDEQGLRGTVRRIAQMITTPELKSLDPLAMSDRRVVEVIIDLDGTSSRQASRLCNLQVDVTILPGPG